MENSVQPIKKMTKKEPITKKQMADERAKDHEMVRGIFRFHEVPGGSANVVYRKYKDDEIWQMAMKDGEVYSIPLMVARHLNKNCWYPEHDHGVDEMGRLNHQFRVSKKIRRMSFQSLEFIDTEDITPVGEATIYTAERIGM
jgi:hypothetical protein